MDIVNAHVHMIDLPGMAERYPNVALPGGLSVLSDIGSALPMLHPDTLLNQMDEAGIATSILYAAEAPIVYASNEYVYALCERYPDRLTGFASVDPADPRAVEKLERAVRELNMRGLKLHPPLQNFFPNDRAVYPIYEKAVELDIPVVFHVGTTPFGPLSRLSQANPILLDDVAVDFPSLRILLTHLGTLWHREAFMVVEGNQNVFIDTAAYITEIPEILTADIIKRIGPDRVIFGTDYPMPYADRPHRMKDFVECIQSLDMPQDTVDGILCRNVKGLLEGRPSAPSLTAAQAIEMFAELEGEGGPSAGRT